MGGATGLKKSGKNAMQRLAMKKIETEKDLVVIKLDSARRDLAEAKSLQQTKRIADIARAAEIYARRQKLGEEAIQYATEIKFEAERKLGEMLKASERNPGTAGLGRPKLGGAEREPPKNTPTLSELGIDRKTSSRAQLLADMPETTFDQIKSGEKSISEARQEIRGTTTKLVTISTEYDSAYWEEEEFKVREWLRKKLSSWPKDRLIMLGHSVRTVLKEFNS